MKCQACHQEVATKEPRCPFCRRWGTVQRWRRMADVSSATITRISSGFLELDTLLGGGLVPGCVYLLSGPPGCGKSTLALSIAAAKSSLYAVAEESASAVRLRFDRLTCSASELLIGEIESVEEIADVPGGIDLVVVDSLHRLRSADFGGAAGSNGQILHGIEVLVTLARSRNLVVLVIAHVNKEGEASGTVGLGHDVDTILEMTRADGRDALGELRVRKNRHGPAPAEIGVRLIQEGIRYE